MRAPTPQAPPEDRSAVTVRNSGVTLGNSDPRRATGASRTSGDGMGKSDKRANDWVIALFVAALGILLTPALQLWAAPGAPWPLPYAVWGFLILLAWAMQRRPDGD